MNYAANRNYGCRFKEIYINGCRSLIIENDLLYMLVLLDKGGDIAEFSYKKTDTDIFWRSPGGLDLLDQTRTGREHYVGGFFEAFPNAGAPCEFDGNHYQNFGDARFLPWEYSVVKDTPEELTLKLFAVSGIFPLRSEKLCTIRLGSAKLDVEEYVTNTTHIPTYFSIGQHANIARPFLDEDCEVIMPEHDYYVLEPGSDGLTAARKVGSYPYYTDGDRTFDTRTVPPFSSGDPELCMLYLDNVKGAYAKVHNRRTGLSFNMEWDPATYKSMLMCRAFVQQSFNSTFGFRYILCLFFTSSLYPSLADAVRTGGAIQLQPGETHRSFYSLSITEDQK